MCLLAGQMTVEREQIQTRKSDQCVDDSGNPAHTAKDESYQVKVEEPDQSPVNRPNDRNGKCKTVQTFIHNSLPPFAPSISGLRKTILHQLQSVRI